jgi:hypothetical protein
VSHRLDRQHADLPGLDRRRQACFDQAEAIGGADLAPAIPAEHRGSVVQGNLPQLGLCALVEEGLDASPHRLQRALQVGAEDDPRDPLRRFRLELLVGGVEQPRLAAEVVVESATGDAGRAHDLLGGDVLVAALSEETPCGSDQCGPRRLGPLGLAAAPRAGTRRLVWLSGSGRLTWIRIYMHTVCILTPKGDTR